MICIYIYMNVYYVYPFLTIVYIPTIFVFYFFGLGCWFTVSHKEGVPEAVLSFEASQPVA